MEQFRKRCSEFFEALWPAEEKTLVFGEGQAVRPPIMLIGEAPGEQETLQGRPFVGKAGKNLNAFLDVVGLERENIYITNVVKVRPTRISDKGRVSNRPPNREELLLFTPYLYDEILLVQPRLIVTLGNVALQSLMGRDTVIGSVHGREQQVSLKWQGAEHPLRMVPLYHPASVIYNRSLNEVYQQDLLRLKDILEQGK